MDLRHSILDSIAPEDSFGKREFHEFSFDLDVTRIMTVLMSKSAVDQDYDNLYEFLRTFHLRQFSTDRKARVVKVIGYLSDFTKAFDTIMAEEKTHNITSLSIPYHLKEAVTAVLGFDVRKKAKHHSRRFTGNVEVNNSKPVRTSAVIANEYGFDVDTQRGKGKRLAIVELGGGFQTSDINIFWKILNNGLPVPPINAISVDNAVNSPGNQADGEVELDIQVALGVAPQLTLDVYFAPNTDQGFVDVFASSIHNDNKPDAITNSWGGPLSGFSGMAIRAMDQLFEDAHTLGISIFSAAGDNGSGDNSSVGLDVDYPGASLWMISCGGTSLPKAGTDNEVAWGDPNNPDNGATGGGFASQVIYPNKPSYQNGRFNENKRGVPDISGCADPQTGYTIALDGNLIVVGGTSAVAPLWAAMAASHGGYAFWSNGNFYANRAKFFRPIQSGTNDISNLGAYTIVPEHDWSPVCGLGVPIGSAILAHLKGSS